MNQFVSIFLSNW